MTGLANFSGVSSTAEGLYLGGRIAPEQRICRGWPLDPVDLEVPVTAADIESGGEWPPARCRPAQTRLLTYDQLYRGDQTQFVGSPGAVAIGVNFYGTLATGLARLAARSLVTRTVEGGGLIVDLVRYGRCYVDSAGEVLSPITTWRDADGEALWVVEPYASIASVDGRADRAVVRHLHPDGGVELNQEWSPSAGALTGMGTLGPATAGGREIDGRWGMGNTQPTEHRWGHRIYESMIPVCVEMSCRLTDSAEQLNRASNILLLGIAVGDSPGTIGDELGFTGGYNGVTPNEAGSYRAALRRIYSSDTIWKSESLASTQYSAPDLEHLAQAFHSYELCLRALRTIAPIASAQERDQGEVASGSAQISMSATMAYASEGAHREALEALDMAGVTVDWPTPSLITQSTIGGDAGGEVAS